MTAPGELDLERLRAQLVDDLGARTLGYVVGRTRLRDAVARRLGCSILEAERLVDTLVARGLVRYEGDPASAVPGQWVLERGG